MLLDFKGFQERQLQPVVATCDDLRILLHCIDLEVFGVDLFATDFEHIHNFFPRTAALEVSVDSTFWILPCMLHGTIEQGGRLNLEALAIKQHKPELSTGIRSCK